MIAMVVVGSFVAAAVIGVEALRWVLRPEARRLRTIRKIDGRR
jgi:hypothetical protein